MNRSTHLAKALDTVMDIHCKQPAGDILVFLTGQEEIENACRALERMNHDLDYEYPQAHTFPLLFRIYSHIHILYSSYVHDPHSFIPWFILTTV